MQRAYFWCENFFNAHFWEISNEIHIVIFKKMFRPFEVSNDLSQPIFMYLPICINRMTYDKIMNHYFVII